MKDFIWEDPATFTPRSSSECPDTQRSERAPEAQRVPPMLDEIPVTWDDDDDGEDLIDRALVWCVAGIEVRVTAEHWVTVYPPDDVRTPLNKRELCALSLALLEAAESLP